MVKKIISSLTLSLMLFSSGTYASDDSDSRAAAASSGTGSRMPNLSVSSGMPRLDSDENSRMLSLGMPNLAGTESSHSYGMSNSSSSTGTADRIPSLGVPSLTASAGSLGEDDSKQSRSASSSQAVSSVASGSGVVESGFERGLDILHRQLATSPVALGVHPNDLLKANNFLYGKYQSYLQSKFNPSGLTQLDLHFMAFLTNNERVFPSLIDPYMMRVFLGFLTPLNTQGLAAPIAMWSVRFQSIIPEAGRVLLAVMSRTQGGQLQVNLDGGLRLLSDAIVQPPTYMMQSPVPGVSGNGVPVGPLGPVYAQFKKL